MAPSTLADVNAVEITTELAEGETLDMTGTAELTREAADQRVQQMFDGGLRPHGKIVISMKGGAG